MLRDRIISIGLAPCLAYSIFYALCVFSGMAGGRTWTFGYYGEYNRVKHALTDMPGVVITREWANEDTTLEEFGFDLSTPTKRAVSLNFQEADSTRRLSGTALTHALQDRLQTPEQSPNA